MSSRKQSTRDGQANGEDPESRQADPTLTEIIREQPIAALAIAAAAGYVFGGGVRRSTILAMLVQIAVRQGLSNMVSDALGNTHDA
jgi:Na+-translocating ferredoxin:NAD+ oxidoreductase RnfD subunit